MAKLIISAGHDPALRKTAEVQRVRDIANALRNYCDFEQIPDGLGGTTDNANLIKKIAWANARQTSSDYYIAIHSNAGGGTGVETYFYGGDSTSEAKGKKLQEFVIAETGLKDRGTKPDTSTTYKRLGEVRDTKAWAWLVECGFHDNASDMAVPADKFARGIARYIQFLGLPVRNLDGGGGGGGSTDPCIDVKNQLTTANSTINELSTKLGTMETTIATLNREKDVALDLKKQADEKVLLDEEKIKELNKALNACVNSDAYNIMLDELSDTLGYLETCEIELSTTLSPGERKLVDIFRSIQTWFKLRKTK